MNAPEALPAAAPNGAILVANAPLGHFAPSLTNRTHDDAYIRDELAPSLKPHGVLQPITARPWPASRGPAPKGVRYEIVIGEGRWLASAVAGLSEIPFFWRDVDDKQALEMQLIENLKRRDLTPIEEGEGYRRLIDDHAHTADTIADKIGKSRSYVYNQLKLLDLCPDARTALLAKKLDPSVALLIARIPGATLQKRALKEVTEGYDGEPLSYRTAQRHLRNHFTLSLKQATFPLDDATLVPAAGSCTACPKRSGNAPEICADLDDEDVCTDTHCFDDKRLTRRQQLIDSAEKRGIEVFTGDKARQVAPHGTASLDTDKYVNLDDVVEGDGQERTYREILGDKAPVAALVEVGYNDRSKQLLELGEPTALAKALKKAGWTPDLFKDAATKEEQEKQRAQREAEEAEFEARRVGLAAEKQRRNQFASALIERLGQFATAGDLDVAPIIGLLPIAWVRFDLAFNGEVDTHLLERHSITLPDDYEDEEEVAHVAATMEHWSVGQALAFVFDVLTTEERTIYEHNYDPQRDQPHILLKLAKAIDFDTALLLTPASTPTEAAQAHEEGATAKPRPENRYARLGADGEWMTWSGRGKKPAWVQEWLNGGGVLEDLEAKTDPAPATPANEPPAAAKPSALKPATAWPFPTGSRKA